MNIIGHRGAKGYQPENTLASFREAISLGVDMIELDVYKIASGEVVVIHDDTVDRTTDGKGVVADFNLNELRMLDAGNGQRVPLLTEVLDLVDRRMPVNIEIKGQDCAKAVAEIIRDHIDCKGWRNDLFLVSSFDLQELRDFTRLSPDVPVSALFENADVTKIETDLGNTIVSVGIDALHITRQNVRDAHMRGVRVYAYTVNTQREAARMRRLKVDGVFSDYPDRMTRQRYMPRRLVVKRNTLVMPRVPLGSSVGIA